MRPKMDAIIYDVFLEDDSHWLSITSVYGSSDAVV